MKWDIYKTRPSAKHTPVKQNLSNSFLLSNNLFEIKNIYLQTIHLEIVYVYIYIYKDLALNNPQGLICH